MNISNKEWQERIARLTERLVAEVESLYGTTDFLNLIGMRRSAWAAFKGGVNLI